MSQIAFSCPGCQQNLEAQPEHAGMEVSCPHCQTVMVVPQPAEAAPAPAGPKGKYSKSASTTQHSATSSAAASKIVRKGKKPNWKLFIGLGVGAAVIGAGIYFGPQLFAKYQEHKDQVAAAQAATNVPPPPPELTSEEILQKLSALYKAIPSYSVHGDTEATMDMSQLNPMLSAPIQTTASFSMLLGRPEHFRIEWQREAAGKTTRGSAWSAGKGDYIQTGTTPIRMKNHETTLASVSGYSGTLGIFLATSFFSDTNSLEVVLKNFSKTNNETLNGRKCYVLTGKLGMQRMLVWVHKDDFLIAQMEAFLGGKVDDSVLASLSAAQKKQLQMMEKMKGNITETYSDIETNKTLNASDFQVAMVVAPRSPKPQRAGEAATLSRGRREKP